LELIEKYITGNIGQEESEAVEKRLNEDSGLMKLKEEMSQLIAGIQRAGRNDVLDKLKNLEATLPPVDVETKVVPIFRRPFVLGIAASISIIIVSAYFIFFQASTSHSELFEQHFEAYPNIIAPTVRGTETAESLKAQAYYTYDLGQYEEALGLLTKIPSTEDEGATLLYRGMCHLMIGQNDEAITVFTEYKASEFELFLPQVNWYLGLTHLRKGEVESAKSVWEEIPEGNSYREKVENLSSNL